MKCWRTFLRRNFCRYLDGELDPPSVKRFEDHLLDCGSCRARLAALREGQRLARQIPRPAPARDRWDSIEAAIEAQEERPAPQIAPREERSFPRVRPGPAIALTAAAFLLVLLGVIANKRSLIDSRGVSSGLDPAEFQNVAIADIPSNTTPHVVTEGYVSELRIDPDGDMTFRLVEDLRRADPFIVCEIIRPIHIAPPEIGSRVRVYGVSRYDGQPNRQWHEVHPVLNIEVVSR